MSEHKIKEENRTKMFKIGFSFRERVVLALHLLQNIKPANRSDRKRFDTLFNDLGLDDIAERLDGGGGISPKETQRQDVTVFDVTGEVIDYLYEKLDGPSNGPATLTIADIERRIEDVKADRYTPPLAENLPSEEAAPAPS